ncbi:MAG: radical SAM protein [Candidatus Cloacimonadota bacterium]|nr:radical SAM protein [Candidatus Cloacimonadota bacterium]
MSKINKHYRNIKTAIRKSKLPDWYFCSKYSLSPYMACEHACKYCDGRAEKYYVKGDYEKDIVIRRNLPEQLSKEIIKLREPGIIFIGSGISDSYQPVEKEEKIMQHCAKIFVENNFPVGILTKSALIQRDIDLWKKVHEKNGFLLMISLTTLDDDIRQIFEPNASSVTERLGTIKKFKSAGIPVGVAAMPILPFIQDSEKDLNKLFAKFSELKVDFVMPGSLTLRPGIQKEVYLRTIQKQYPQFLAKYEDLYSDDFQSGVWHKEYRQKAYKIFHKVSNEFSFPIYAPHYIYKNKFSLYDELYILLKNMTDLYELKNQPTPRLEYSVNNYNRWLKKEKQYFNRNRSLHYSQLEEKLKYLLKFGKLYDIIRNKKLINFISEIILERKTFDYKTLKLISVHP